MLRIKFAIFILLVEFIYNLPVISLADQLGLSSRVVTWFPVLISAILYYVLSIKTDIFNRIPVPVPGIKFITVGVVLFIAMLILLAGALIFLGESVKSKDMLLAILLFSLAYGHFILIVTIITNVFLLLGLLILFINVLPKDDGTWQLHDLAVKD